MESQTLRIFIIICGFLCTTRNLCSATHNDESVVNIGVILNYNSWVGKVAKTAIQISAEDVKRDSRLLNGSRLVLHFRDSRGDAVLGASAAIDLLEREVVAIIGPETSEVAEFILHLGDAAQVPVVSFSATNPFLSNQRFPYFVRMAHSDALQMQAIAALVQAYGWRRITAVYTDDDFGAAAVSSLCDALRMEAGSEVEYRLAISPTADQQSIRDQLNKLKKNQSTVFVVHMNSDLGSRILMEAHNMEMMDSGYVWITTDGFTNLWDVLLDSHTGASMQGLLGVKTYVQNSNKLGYFTRRWKRQFRLENPDEEKAELNLYGLFAYDAVWMIAHAIGTLGNISFNFSKPVNPRQVVVEHTTDLTDLKVFQEGPQLLKEILNTNFSGVSGVVQLHDGEIVGSTYEIVNVVGNGYHVVGTYWNNEIQISKQLPSHALSPSSQNNTIDKLGIVIWPGRSTEVPRGWVQPTIGNRMKIGVPITHGSTEFISVAFDRVSNQSKVTGFCIDVFNAVLSRLDYALPYDFIPYDQENYDDLVYQVYLKNFDAVVGDTTILANRSRFVDFTQPFTESGLVMVVPIKEEERNKAWAFLLPFTPGMWCATGTFLTFTGFVIWLFEHRVNPEFRGKPRDQVVTLLWLSFSTLFFSHREKLMSSLSRLVLIIWLFVVQILTSSYTASLTSMLTVQQLNPTIKNVESLRASGAAVGYLKGSFVAEYLQQEFGIAKENLRTYSTPDEAGEALSKGPNNGGVAAIFDEIHHIRLFLASHCGYTMVGPVYRTGGFGFVFPKGSLLVSDISRAVLSLSEDKEMQGIQAKWLNSTACTNSETKVDSNRLSIGNFWGLYLITGAASLIALIIFFSSLLNDYMKDRNVEGNDNSELGDPSTGKSLKSLYRAMKSFIEYVDQKEGSTSAPRSRVSVIAENSQYSTPVSIPSPSALGTSHFNTHSMSASTSFSFLDLDHMVAADENTVARSSCVSEPDTGTSPFNIVTSYSRSLSIRDPEDMPESYANTNAGSSSI